MEIGLVNWKPEYSVGLVSVDKQHKRFISIINELGASIAEHTLNQKGKQIFFSLLHFTEEFLHKEKILANRIEALDYSYFRDKHKHFLAKIKSFKDDYIETADEAKFVELYEYLKDNYNEFISCYTPSLVNILRSKGIE